MRNESCVTAVEKSHEGDSKETMMRNYLHRLSTNGTSDAQEKELRKKAGGTVSGLSRDYRSSRIWELSTSCFHTYKDD